jgi:hypothetical protein
MSENYCDKHYTANHTEGSEHCRAWSLAQRRERDRIALAVHLRFVNNLNQDVRAAVKQVLDIVDEGEA